VTPLVPVFVHLVLTLIATGDHVTYPEYSHTPATYIL